MSKEIIFKSEFELIEAPRKLIEHVAKKRLELAVDISNPTKINSADRKEFLSLIAKEIKLRVEAIDDHAFYIGKLLFEAKQILPHGEYESWVEGNIPYISRSTAHNCKRVYEAFALSPTAVRSLKKSILYFISSPQCNEELKQAYLGCEFIDKTVSATKLRQISIRMNKGELSIGDEEVQKIIKAKEADIKKGYYISVLCDFSKYVEQINKKVRQIYVGTPIISTDNLQIKQKYDDGLYSIVDSCIQDIVDRIKKTSETLQQMVGADEEGDGLSSKVEQVDEPVLSQNLFKRRKV